MGSGFLKKKKQARMMQAEFSSMQEKLSKKLDTLEVTGSAGNGLVQIVLNGGNELKSVKINPECVDPEDIEGLETLIKAAYDDAMNKLKEQSTSELGAPAGGMPDLASLLKF
jgi:nucleoid-associated protein EbfC